MKKPLENKTNWMEAQRAEGRTKMIKLYRWDRQCLQMDCEEVQEKDLPELTTVRGGGVAIPWRVDPMRTLDDAMDNLKFRQAREFKAIQDEREWIQKGAAK